MPHRTSTQALAQFSYRPSHHSTSVGSGDSSFYRSNSSSSPGLIFFSQSGNGDDYLNLSDTTIDPVLESGNGSVLIDSDFMGECDFLNSDMAGANVVQLEGKEEEANEEEKGSLEILRKRSRSTRNVSHLIQSCWMRFK